MPTILVPLGRLDIQSHGPALEGSIMEVSEWESRLIDRNCATCVDVAIPVGQEPCLTCEKPAYSKWRWNGKAPTP